MESKVEIPNPGEIVHLGRILPANAKMLEYVLEEVLTSNKEGSFSYNWRDDELTYHMNVSSLDQELIEALKGVEEIWITMKGMDES
jgi:hypothetical protein